MFSGLNGHEKYDSGGRWTLRHQPSCAISCAGPAYNVLCYLGGSRTGAGVLFVCVDLYVGHERVVWCAKTQRNAPFLSINLFVLQFLVGKEAATLGNSPLRTAYPPTTLEHRNVVPWMTNVIA